MNVKHISEFKDGDIAKVIGKIEIVNEPIIAPLSNRKCASYSVQVEELGGENRKSFWHPFVTEDKSTTFFIKDGNHYAYITCISIKSYIVKDVKFESSTFIKPTEELIEYLHQQGKSHEYSLGRRNLRYKEGILEEGEQVAVIGRGLWRDAVDFNLPESYGKILVITDSAEQNVYLSDDPKLASSKFVEQNKEKKN